jgi:hypothetical protein
MIGQALQRFISCRQRLSAGIPAWVPKGQKKPVAVSRDGPSKSCVTRARYAPATPSIVSNLPD